MSYILDALRKSEEARKRGTVPDVLTVQEAIPQAPAGISRRAYVIAGMLVFAAGIGIWFGFLRAGGRPPAVQSRAAQPQPPSAAWRDNPSEGPATVTPRNGEKDIDVSAGTGIEDRPAEKTKNEALPSDAKRLYRLSELPEGVRKALPDFSIAAFLYSEDPFSRMVRINGRMLREGEDLSPGLRLEEITPDGVIMRHQDYRFSVNVRQ